MQCGPPCGWVLAVHWYINGSLTNCWGKTSFSISGAGLIDPTQETMSVDQCRVPHLKHAQFTETKVVTKRWKVIFEQYSFLFVCCLVLRQRFIYPEIELWNWGIRGVCQHLVYEVLWIAPKALHVSAKSLLIRMSFPPIHLHTPFLSFSLQTCLK